MQLSASSAALDLALAQSVSQQTISDSNGWAAGANAFARHRSSQSQQINSLNIMSSPSPNGASVNGQANPPESPASVRPSYRHSLDLKTFDGFQEPSSQLSSPSKNSQATPPKLQPSYSANDVPTMRSTTNGMSSSTSSSNSHAQQHLHNQNASLGRIPTGAMNNRLSREISSPETATLRETQNGAYQSIQSALHASAPAFGPSVSQSITPVSMPATLMSPTTQAPYPVNNYYPGYNMQLMTMGMQNMQIAQQPIYSPNNPYAYPAGGMYPQTAPRDSQARVIQQRRQNDGEGMYFCQASA